MEKVMEKDGLRIVSSLTNAIFYNICMFSKVMSAIPVRKRHLGISSRRWTSARIVLELSDCKLADALPEHCREASTTSRSLLRYFIGHRHEQKVRGEGFSGAGIAEPRSKSYQKHSFLIRIYVRKGSVNTLNFVLHCN